MHVIRLRRPWEKGRGDGSGLLRIDVPELGLTGQDLVGQEQGQRRPAATDRGVTFEYQRRFNLPSGLQACSRVSLCVDGWEGLLESVSLNGVPLESGETKVNVDVTAFLEPHNKILLRLRSLADQPARLSGEVTLMIEDLDP